MTAQTPAGVLRELALRCEAATVPDRALDAEINVAVRGFPEKAYQQKNGMRPKGTPDLDRMEFVRQWGVSGFTSSLDAALTLVPEGWRVSDLHQLDVGGWTVLLWFGPGSGVCINPPTGRANTSAPALTAAALRARAQAPQ